MQTSYTGTAGMQLINRFFLTVRKGGIDNNRKYFAQFAKIC